MTAVSFSDEPNSALPSDAIPDLVDGPEYPCEVCGKEAGPYGGRGRKPKRCAEHKRSSNSGTRAPRVTGSNATLATQATEALCSIDGMMALGARIMGFTDTADVIEENDETFRLRVHAALLNSPDMCRRILKMGSRAGDSALFVAIALHVATIAPVFVNEAKLKKAEKEAKRLAELEE